VQTFQLHKSHFRQAFLSRFREGSATARVAIPPAVTAAATEANVLGERGAN
jgi:hypothetical protein